MNTELIHSMKITTPRIMVEKERERVKNIPNQPDFEKRLNGRKWPLEWMTIQFGETLTENDGFTTIYGKYQEADCNVCGNSPAPDEKIVKFKFSFCDEYECSMTICETCIKKIKCSMMDIPLKEDLE